MGTPPPPCRSCGLALDLTHDRWLTGHSLRPKSEPFHLKCAFHENRLPTPASLILGPPADLSSVLCGPHWQSSASPGSIQKHTHTGTDRPSQLSLEMRALAGGHTLQRRLCDCGCPPEPRLNSLPSQGVSWLHPLRDGPQNKGCLQPQVELRAPPPSTTDIGL